MTKITDEQKNIQNLEEKYFKKLLKIFQSDDFMNDLKTVQKETIRNYEFLTFTWNKSNKIDTALERLAKYHVLKDEIVTDIYASPVSSDLGFYVDDAIICIDTKTVNRISNASDIQKVMVSRNQINFKNKSVRCVPYHVQLPETYDDKYILTYLLQLEYTEEVSKSEFKMDNLNFACVPNGKLSNIYKKDIIQGYKTYSYVSKKLAENFEIKGFEGLHPQNSINKQWKQLNSKYNVYKDEDTKNPYWDFFKDDLLWRKYKADDYRVVISADTARVDPKKLKTDSLEWERFITWDTK